VYQGDNGGTNLTLSDAWERDEDVERRKVFLTALETMFAEAEAKYGRFRREGSDVKSKRI
jgi:hypothetical protein